MAPEGVSGTPLGVIWGSLDSLFGVFGGLLAAVGCLRGPLGLPGGSWDVLGRFPGFSGMIAGGLLAPFWANFGCVFALFSGRSFLIDF